MKLYFRTLCFPAHYKHFSENNPRSTHNIVTGEWSRKWQETRSTNVSDYNLTTSDGPFSLNALKAFLDCAPNYKVGDIWQEEDTLRCGELEGLCVFTNPKAALEYGSLAGSDLIDCYVIYSGIELGPLPEDNGLVLGNAILKDGPLNRNNFRAKYIDQ